MSSAPAYRRYVAIGDSSTEGLDDPDGRGGYRGWADRLAAKVAEAHPGLLYANFGVRGRTTAEILATQLEPALALTPDVMTLFSGTNDVIARRFDAGETAAAIATLQRAIRARGVTLLTFTLPDLGPVLPAARHLAPRIELLNDAVRTISRETGTIVVDMARLPVAVDPRLWSEDRIHANAAGHARIAAALAEALGLPGSDRSWSAPLPSAPASTRLVRFRADARWTLRHLLPWWLRKLSGRSISDGIEAKRPQLLPVGP